jgi:integrase
MASIGREGERGELKRIIYRDAAGKQQSLRLGKCSERAATNAQAGFERVYEAHRVGSTIHPDGVRWLEAIDDRLHARVVRLGLGVEPRKAADVVTLGGLLAAFFAGVDVKPATRVRMKQAETVLVGYFTKTRDVATINLADADGWRANLKTLGYAPATIARTVIYARQVWRWAVRRGMAKANPFAELKAGSQTNTARQVFIDRATIAKVIEAAPDAEWRLLIALSRFGGLRVPSEALALRWADVDWEHNRLTVRSPKTEHHEGGGERIVPLFPEIREHLQAVFDAAPVGSVNVIGRYREGANLNPHFRRIIKRAGLTPWDRTWHNLRASRQTELAATFPLHTVCAWIGNTKAIAAGHYLQVTDADWTRATGTAEAAANPATQVRPRASTASDPKTQNPQNPSGLVGVGVPCDAVENQPMVATGLEHPANPAGNTPVSDSGGSKSGNIRAGFGPPTPPAPIPAKPTDPELASVIAAWPDLPPAIRAGVLALVKAAESGVTKGGKP